MSITTIAAFPLAFSVTCISFVKGISTLFQSFYHFYSSGFYPSLSSLLILPPFLHNPFTPIATTAIGTTVIPESLRPLENVLLSFHSTSPWISAWMPHKLYKVIVPT